jgi:hypothetical protein
LEGERISLRKLSRGEGQQGLSLLRLDQPHRQYHHRTVLIAVIRLIPHLLSSYKEKSYISKTHFRSSFTIFKPFFGKWGEKYRRGFIFE